MSSYGLEGKHESSSTPAAANHKPEVAATEELLGGQKLGVQTNYRVLRCTSFQRLVYRI